MARKLLELEEAAHALGVTVEQLNAMRDRREVYAVRDGGAWKFKPEEIERLISEREAGAPPNRPRRSLPNSTRIWTPSCSAKWRWGSRAPAPPAP